MMSGIVFLGTFDSKRELVFEKVYASDWLLTRILLLVEICLDLFEEKLSSPSNNATVDHCELLQSIGDLYAFGKVTATRNLILAIINCSFKQGMMEAEVKNLILNVHGTYANMLINPFMRTSSTSNGMTKKISKTLDELVAVTNTKLFVPVSPYIFKDLEWARGF